MRLLRVLSHFASTPWALELGTLTAMASVLERAAAEGRDLDFSGEIEAKAPDRAAADAGAKQNVAVIAVYGVIAHRAHMVQGICGPTGTSAETLEATINAALEDPTVRSIVLDVNSPGGSVQGIQELADTIFQGRAKKPIAAVANSTAASAAYWFASAAHELYVIPSGEVGSIGVYAKHVDTTAADKAAGKETTIFSAGKYKAEGAGALTDDAKEYLQSRVDGYYTDFVKTVARNRDVKVDAVRNGYGQGRVLSAKAALEAGMVDGVMTLSQVIQKYAHRTTGTANKTRAEAVEEIRSLTERSGPTT
jgi:signal peptide peptidase SppA